MAKGILLKSQKKYHAKKRILNQKIINIYDQLNGTGTSLNY